MKKVLLTSLLVGIASFACTTHDAPAEPVSKPVTVEIVPAPGSLVAANATPAKAPEAYVKKVKKKHKHKHKKKKVKKVLPTAEPAAAPAAATAK